MADQLPAMTVGASAVDSAAASRCPRCDQTFGCGVALQVCWCHEIELSAEALAQLRERYDACLCPGCLREWATARAPSLEPAPDEATATRSGQPPVVAVSERGTDQA